MHSEDVGTTPDLLVRMGSYLRNMVRKALATHDTRTSFSLSESTCASSVGGPGLNFGEHIAGRSRFGTVEDDSDARHDENMCMDVPKKPSFGRSNSGSAISAFTPHTTVVDPSLTSADPSAVDIEPSVREKGTVNSPPHPPRARRVSRMRAHTYVHRDIPPFVKVPPVRPHVLREEPLEVGSGVQTLEGERLERVLLRRVRAGRCRRRSSSSHCEAQSMSRTAGALKCESRTQKCRRRDDGGRQSLTGAGGRRDRVLLAWAAATHAHLALRDKIEVR